MRARAFIGSYVLGMGFTFDDTDKKGVANPISLMHELIRKDPRNAERIFPYIGGEEVNDSPTHAITATSSTSAQMSEDEARAMAGPDGDCRGKGEAGAPDEQSRFHSSNWWQYAETPGRTLHAIRGLDRVLVTARVSVKHGAFAFLAARQCVLSEQLVVFASDALMPASQSCSPRS